MNSPTRPVGGYPWPGVGGCYFVQLGGDVGDLAVDLARCDVPGVGGGQVRQGPLLSAECGEHVQRGEHASVGAPEVAEVVVPGVLAAEDGVMLGHQGLHVGMADTGTHRAPAVLSDDLHGSGAGDDVVHDGRAWVAGKLAGGDKADDRGRRDGLTALIDEKAPVGEPTPGGWGREY